MTFEDWWEENDRRMPEYWSAREAWDAATAAERQRCREIAEEHERHASVIGQDVANSIAEDIGE